MCLFSVSRIVCSFASSIICNRVPGLTPAQRQLCSEAPDAFIALGDGHILGAEECQHQFKGKEVYTFRYFISFHFICVFCFRHFAIDNNFHQFVGNYHIAILLFCIASRTHEQHRHFSFQEKAKKRETKNIFIYCLTNCRSSMELYTSLEKRCFLTHRHRW